MAEPDFEREAWDKLADAANSGLSGLSGQGAVVEAGRRMVAAIERADKTASKLSRHIYWLNIIIVACTVIMTVLTGCQLMKS